MSRELKFTLSLAILIVGFVLTSADTRIFISVGNSNRTESITLDKDQYLSVKGSFEQYFDIPKDRLNKLFLTVIYMADKYGYKAKYVLVKKQYAKSRIHLSSATLKSTAG
ncbi:uncharacterized protein LOC119599560 [Lucilia sericata]|uniref:uncharacterized protein LOC119599560 n=1 Tax=Lucilia sericata TaxID=13632 RepID=UPI0018A812C5|nr:uncharacterized protein LOC119599560 [Lucilia sericata]